MWKIPEVPSTKIYMIRPYAESDRVSNFLIILLISSVFYLF